MPIAYIESLDDPLLFDRQQAWDGGQVSHYRLDELNQRQAWMLQDVDVDTNGALRTRLGWHALGNLSATIGAVAVQGAWWFDSPTWEGLLVVAGGKLYKGASGGTWTKVADSAVGSATAPAYAAQINETIYIGTGGDRPKLWSAATIAATGAGTAVTDGPAKLSHLAAQNFRLFGLNADTPDEIYCSGFLPTSGTPFGSIESFRVGEGEGDPVTALIPWKGWNLCVFKADSTWAVNTSSVSPTDLTTYTHDFTIQRLSSRVGCIAHRSAAPAGNDLLFLARDGVRSLAKTQEDGDGAVSLPLSDPIQDVMDRINMSYVHLACAGWWRGKYMLAVPLDDSTVNNAVLVLNLRTGGWTVWTGLQASAFAITSFSGQQQRCAMLDLRRQMTVFRDHVQPVSRTATDYKDTLDLSTYTKPDWRVRSRGMTFGEALNPKQPRSIEVTFDQSEATFDVRLISDDDANSSSLVASKQVSGLPAVRLPAVLPFTLGESRLRRLRYDLTGQLPCRSMSVEIEEAAGMTTTEDAASGPLGMTEIIASAWLNAMET